MAAMNQMNPMNLMMMLKNGNPRQVAMQIIQNNYPNDPRMNQLIQMADRGDIQGLQKIAEQVFGAQGKNFSAEMSNLMQSINRF